MRLMPPLPALLMVANLVASPQLMAQEGQRALQAEKQAPQREDVVVTGQRDLDDLDDPDSAVTRKTLGSGKTGAGPTVSRSVFAFSRRFARCAMKRSPKGLSLVRRVLDGQINSATHRYAQRRLVQAYVACSQNPSMVLQSETGASISRNYNTFYYDRGALFIEALNSFAPDLRLTKEQTTDTTVHARFDAREVPLARMRDPIDRSFFEMAVCLVRLNPEIAVELVRAEGGISRIDALEAALVNKGRVCIGGAKRVYFDATQFRFYIADAVYRWAVAAKGVDTLIPKG
ncbi:hypothetical protein OKW76_09025 [Sphingomonas sp. S1-29]|uniref:hypothetical protein n=1 Tax=Sphingomonas sp. S1-29 TaxID=2991074 RepID=UPI00223F3F5F|nr:hypothetical protein [Sphingomonas sp. S1-29]UZK68216.1 hypothetical protein OKW76_09025 [Sphingomonas sp. S1-29]